MRTLPEPAVGEVWDINFDPVVGHEQGGFRPALVVSNNPFNETPHGLCIVAPITGTVRDVPSQIEVAAVEGGLNKRSVIMCEQVRSASLQRFRRQRGAVSDRTLALVQATVARFIDY